MKDKSKEVEKELRKELAKIEREHEAVLSKGCAQLQEIQHKIQVISAESEATRQGWELEKDELLLQIAAARKETETISQELHRKLEQNQHLWDADKLEYKGTLTELQFKLELHSHINEDLSTTVLSLKDQLRECNAKLILMEDEKQMLKALALSASNVMKDSSSKCEQQITNLQRQLLAIGKENYSQIFDLQSQTLTTVGEKRRELRDIVNQMDMNEKQNPKGNSERPVPNGVPWKGM